MRDCAGGVCISLIGLMEICPSPKLGPLHPKLFPPMALQLHGVERLVSLVSNDPIDFIFMKGGSRERYFDVASSVGRSVRASFLANGMVAVRSQ